MDAIIKHYENSDEEFEVWLNYHMDTCKDQSTIYFRDIDKSKEMGRF